ncbi:MAG: hypothetical protein MUF78_08800 [Candidatus Edwardsbacteria bacterium]|jgi:hypothetical protein|nr:hypothetical protein [Candidatus Edwardsbacteria bacterium]
MTSAEAAAFKPKLDRIAEIFHQNPVLKDPKGFDARVTARIFYPYEWGTYPQEYGFVGEVRVFLEYWFEWKGKVVKQTIEPPQFTAFVNNYQVLMHGPYSQSGEGDPAITAAAAKLRELLAPEKVRELGPGVTRYTNLIVVSDPQRPLYLPVTVGEVFSRQLSYWRLLVKKDKYMKPMLDMIEQEWATVDPGDKGQPAYHALNAAYVSAQPNNRAVVRFNPDYFDRTLPRTAVQLVTIPVPDDMDVRKDADFLGQGACGYLRLYQLARAHDPAALRALIDVK